MKRFQCGACNYRATQKEQLLRHLWTTQNKIDIKREGKRRLTHHKKEVIMPPTQTSMHFYCALCNFSTTTEKILQVHLRRHNLSDQDPLTRVYPCVLCRYVNQRRRNLFQHMRKKHIGIRRRTVSQVMTHNTSTASITASEMSENTTEVPMLDEQQKIVIKQNGSSSEVVGTVETVKHLEHIVAHPSAEALHSPDGDGIESLELSLEELSGLNSGDVVQIDGQHFLVELTQDPSNPYKQILSLLAVTTTSVSPQLMINCIC